MAASDRPEGTERRGQRPAPSARSLNRTLAAVGLDVELTDEAVQQLAKAAAAAEAYLRAYPEQAGSLGADPQAFLRGLVDEGLLTEPVEALEATIQATRRAASARPPQPTAGSDVG